MDLALSEVLAQLSDRGRIEWQLAVERARNARLAAMLQPDDAGEAESNGEVER